MKTETVKILELDGSQLYYSMIAGAHRIFEHQKLLNKINVFPVPDADTGTNLASTMRSIIDAKIPLENLKQTATAIADAALTGARGNSGIIFAQFLYGFSNEIKTDAKLDVKDFAESMKNAVSYAYDAIANPVEGTILTVIKDWADQLYMMKDMSDDFINLLIEAYQKALESLTETTEKLEVLARAHVVDAGAKGFVYFLEGIKDFFINGEKAITQLIEEVEEEGVIVEMAELHKEITFRFCTEALISGTNLEKNKIQEAFQTKGDSLVIAGTPQKMRLHIHTDYPAEVLSGLSRFGTISYQKVDDMVMQSEIMHHRQSDIAIVTDSTCDLPEEILEKHQIHMLPLSVHFGDSFYLDRVTMNPQEFYQMVEQTEVRPTTSQPTVKEFQNKYEYLSSHYKSMIGVFVSEKLSGTYQNSLHSAYVISERTGKSSYIYNSRNLSAALGLVVFRIARAIEEGMTLDEILPKIDTWIGKSYLRVTIPTLSYIIKSGRISPFRSFIARALDLKPFIIIDDEGKSELVGKSLTLSGAQGKLLANIRKMLHHDEVWEYAITHADNQGVAEFYAEEMEKLTGKKPLFTDHVSPVLVANTGPGVVGISLMLK
ncbi:MAG: DegV family EDD domain-containing protein [Bacteroidales bacterium]|nr:DegV family EDD domain-containing protein [Bacteroidota bacterium]MBL6950013.1 DegV family EDD domain-containing protein [Bacteroidales bacterium]